MSQDWKVQLFKLNFDQREAEAVAAVIDSGWFGSLSEAIREMAARVGGAGWQTAMTWVRGPSMLRNWRI